MLKIYSFCISYLNENISTDRNQDSPHIRFSYAGTWELANQFVGTKNFSYHICYETIGRKHNIAKYCEVKRQTDHGQTGLSNMLVKKNVLNEINKGGAFTQGFKDCSKIKR